MAVRGRTEKAVALVRWCVRLLQGTRRTSYASWGKVGKRRKLHRADCAEHLGLEFSLLDSYMGYTLSGLYGYNGKQNGKYYTGLYRALGLLEVSRSERGLKLDSSWMTFRFPAARVCCAHTRGRVFDVLFLESLVAFQLSIWIGSPLTT